MDKNKIFATVGMFAYTLAELIVVMLIIAVVVSVSIKLAKTKLDNITSYTYYSAYSTLRSVTSEMVRDFRVDESYGIGGNADDEADLSNASFNQNIFAKLNTFFTSLLFQPAFGISCGCTSNRISEESCPISQYNFQGDLNSNYCDGGYEQNFKNRCINGNGIFSAHTDPNSPYYRCLCCNPIPDAAFDPNPDLPGVGEVGGNCPEGQRWNKVECVDVRRPDDYDNPPCGKEYVWDSSSSNYVQQDIAGFDRSCSANEQFSDVECECVPTPRTTPRTGKAFCESFVGYANTAQVAESEECKGDVIADNTTEFGGKKPDFILRNGMYVYNASQDPKKLDILAGNSKGSTYPASDGSTIDIDEFGYTVYVDIDGNKNGDGVLWEDVFPFYVTLSGTLIPAYDIDNPETVGGDSKQFLQTSVRDEYIDDTTGRHVEWLTKSRSFKESACLMGMVKEGTPYCSSGTAVAGNSGCGQNSHDCRLKTVMPVKFFGN